MSSRQRPQNACDFPPRRPPTAAGWLLGMSGKGEPSLMWLSLVRPVSGESPLCRTLGRRYCTTVAQIVYTKGNAAMLVKGIPDELASIARVCDAGNFHPEVVDRGWHQALPVPAELLAYQPLGGDRNVQVIALDPDSAPKDEILRLLSHDAKINLTRVVRELAPLGVFSLLAGKGRREAVAVLEELHAVKRLPSRERAGVILSVTSDDVAHPWNGDANSDHLILEFIDSQADQLAGFYSGVLTVFPPDHSVNGGTKAPRPGSNVNAEVTISMRPRPQNVRDQLEDYARKVGGGLGMRAKVSWMINGARLVRPDLQ